ncbi:MAG: hypothetical protein FWF36_03150 [Propionibacteriaceae bacterium]|nr:hypothetical protein [Propionibacteriaceae bacterium]
MRAALIANPNLKAATAAIRAVRAASRLKGWDEPMVLQTTTEHPGQEQTWDALDADVDRIVVAGGDGTVRLVAGALAESGELTGLGIVPIGAANIVARNLGLYPGPLETAAMTALTGRRRPLSVSWVAFRRKAQSGDITPMLAVAGIGRDGEAVAATQPWMKRRGGWMAYAATGARQALRPAIPMKVTIDDGPAEMIRAWSVLAANLPRVPMGVVAFPDASPGARSMQVLQVCLKNPAEWVPVAVKGLTHHDAPVSALKYCKAERLLVEPGRPMPVQIDGDLMPDVAAMSVTLQPAAIYVVT